MNQESSILSVVRKASSLLKDIQQKSAAENARQADELLLFLYDLNDHYKLTRSKSTRFSGTLSNILKDLIYNLESQPDTTFQSESWLEFIQSLLQDLSNGKLLLTRQ